MVRLTDGEIGNVTNSLGRVSNPIVHAVVGLWGAPLTMPLSRNTSSSAHAIQEAVDPSKVNVKIQIFSLWSKGGTETALTCTCVVPLCG